MIEKLLIVSVLFICLAMITINQIWIHFLADALVVMNKLAPEELSKLMQLFIHSMEMNFLLFKQHSFRKSLQNKSKYSDRTVINIALFDVCSVLMARYDKSKIVRNAKDLTDGIAALIADYDFFQSISYGTNGIRQVEMRFEKMEELFLGVLGAC